MGAIAAIIAREASLDPRRVEQMLAAAPHRGATVSVIRLGHAIVGVTSLDGPTDAWVSSDNGLEAAVTGTLDNRDELVTLLRKLGQPPLPSSDPAALLIALFRQFGTETPKYLRGMLAAVITDGAQLLAFRDHVGFGTLFYREDPRGIFVASEAKQVIIGANLGFEPDVDVLERILYSDLDDEMPSALRGVRRLPRASLLRCTPQAIAVVERYWHPERLLETARLSLEDLRVRFDELMTRAVSRTLTPDSVMALSGGIDSNAVAAFAAPLQLKLTGRPLAALSAMFPDHPRVDEGRYINLVTEHAGIHLHTFASSVPHLDRLDYWVQLTDGPSLASMNEMEERFLVARALGYRTILTGDFGEFLYDMRDHLLPHLVARRRFPAARRLLGTPHRRGVLRASTLRQVLSPFVPPWMATLYIRLAGHDRNPAAPNWLEARRVHAVYRPDLRIPPARRWLELQLLAFKGPGIGVESEETCAALHGFRVRRPLADVDLWEFFLSLPAEVKFPDTRSKTLMRALLREKVLDPILDRSDKTYFDDFVISRINYPVLRHWLLDSRHQMPGVDYNLLRDRLERQDFTLSDYAWAKDLAEIHAFLSLWNG